MNAWTEQRHRFLLDVNIGLLRQGLELLELTSDDAYAQAAAGLSGQRIGSHLRHVIEFYECFLDGRRRCQIDYDARRRDPELESSRGACIRRIEDLITRLSGSEAPLQDSVVFIRVEDAAGIALDHDHIVSSIGRELQALASHTVHHFGLVGMIARLLGINVDPSFGFAPSTLRYRETRRREAA